MNPKPRESLIECDGCAKATPDAKIAVIGSLYLCPACEEKHAAITISDHLQESSEN